MQTEPESFAIATHQRVSSSIQETTLSFSTNCISCLTFLCNGSGIFLEVNRQNGLTSGRSWIVYSLLNVVSPEDSVAYCSGILWIMEFDGWQTQQIML